MGFIIDELVLGQDYWYWDRIIGTGTGLLVLGQDYWYWDRIIGTGTGLLVLGQDYILILRFAPFSIIQPNFIANLFITDQK